MRVLNVPPPTPTPHLRFFFLCETIAVRDDDRQIDVTGLLSSYLFTGVTVKMPPCKLTTTLVVGIYSEDHSATYALKVTAQSPGNPELRLWKSQMGLVNGEYVSMARQPCDLEFSLPGTYWFNAYLDGDLFGRYPLTVEYSPTG